MNFDYSSVYLKKDLFSYHKQSPYISIYTHKEFFLRVFDDIQQLILICSGYNAERMR